MFLKTLLFAYVVSCWKLGVVTHIFVKGPVALSRVPHVFKYTPVWLCRVPLEALCRDPDLCEEARSFAKGTLKFVLVLNTLLFGDVVSCWKLCVRTLTFVKGPCLCGGSRSFVKGTLMF